MKAILISQLDSLIIRLTSVVWNLIRVFDPRRLQDHFAKRDPINSVKMVDIFSLPQEDAGQSIVRLCNNQMKSEARPNGLAGRRDLVKIKNPSNGKFVILYAMGAGSHKIPKGGVSLDYDAKLALGIQKASEVELLVGPASIADREYFMMYLDHEVSSRSSRALGWYILIGGIVWSCASPVIDAVTYSVMSFL